MRALRSVRPIRPSVIVVGAVMLLGQLLGAIGSSTRAHAASGGVAPGAVGELDCNGFSGIQRSVKPGLMCADPRDPSGGRFEDNGTYIGHDEPSIRFVSPQAGTSSDITFNETLPVDPPAPPTVSHPGSDITHSFELTIAPWFSMDLCDPNSFPQLPCTPTSDANAPHGLYENRRPDDARQRFHGGVRRQRLHEHRHH